MLKRFSKPQASSGKKYLILYLMLFCVTSWSIGQTLWETAQLIRLRNLSVVMEQKHRQLSTEITQLKAQIDQNKSLASSLTTESSLAYEPTQVYLNVEHSASVANLVAP